MTTSIKISIATDPTGSLARDVCFAFQSAWERYNSGNSWMYHDKIELVHGDKTLGELFLPAYPGAIGLMLMRCYFAANNKEEIPLNALCTSALASIGSAFAGLDAELGITKPLKMDEAVRSMKAIGLAHGCRY